MGTPNGSFPFTTLHSTAGMNMETGTGFTSSVSRGLPAAYTDQLTPAASPSSLSRVPAVGGSSLDAWPATALGTAR